MDVKVVMPQMGESITEGTIIKWHKKVGDAVKKDETLLEISTDKVDSEIPSPASGIVKEILVPEQKTVPVHTVIAIIESEGDGLRDEQEINRPPSVSTEAPVLKQTPHAEPSAHKLVHEAAPADSRFYSPLVLTIAREEGISMEELARIPGTGSGGRVTKKDILAYVESRKATPSIPIAPEQPVAQISPQAAPSSVSELAKRYPPQEFEIIEMTNVMQRMAEHMVRTVHTSPHAFTVSECDVTRIVEYRNRHAEEFERREGFKLTYTPFIAEACVRAIKEFPLINSQVEGTSIIIRKSVNLGIAVASPTGLIVPVVKHADELNFLGLARAINDLAVRARTKKLLPDDVQGGSFSITNYGVFGSIIGLPLINQPQVAILGVGAFQKRPVIVNDAIAIRTMVYLTLSFDHRVVDGELGGKFIERIVQLLEEFDETREL